MQNELLSIARNELLLWLFVYDNLLSEFLVIRSLTARWIEQKQKGVYECRRPAGKMINLWWRWWQITHAQHTLHIRIFDEIDDIFGTVLLEPSYLQKSEPPQWSFMWCTIVRLQVCPLAKYSPKSPWTEDAVDCRKELISTFSTTFQFNEACMLLH